MSPSVKERFGLSEIVIQKINSVFSQYPTIEKVILYGSRAKNNYKAGSDIDLTILSETLSLTDLLKIETEIDELLIPYKIDLSLFNKIEDKEVLEHIKRVGQIFYQKRYPLTFGIPHTQKNSR